MPVVITFFVTFYFSVVHVMLDVKYVQQFVAF